MKVVLISTLKQQAEALSTQFSPLDVLVNGDIYNRDKDELISSERIIYTKYAARHIRQEFFRLRQLLKERRPDAIYVNGFRHLWMIGILLQEPGSYARKPVLLMTSHNSWSWDKVYKRLIMALSCRIFADGVFALASFQEKRLIEFGLSPQKVKTIPNAVDTRLFSPEGARDFYSRLVLSDQAFPIIVNIANINRYKGQDVLIKAIRLVKDKINEVNLVLMGIDSPGSPYSRYLRDLIDELDLSTNVFILGNVDHSQIPAVLRSSDVAVISSWNEVCPFILLESLSAAKVTISTAVGGIPDIINNGLNGFLVKPGDPKEFADAILKLIGNPDLRCSMEKEARKTALENYSFETIGKKHRDFLVLIMKNKKYSVAN